MERPSSEVAETVEIHGLGKRGRRHERRRVRKRAELAQAGDDTLWILVERLGRYRAPGRDEPDPRLKCDLLSAGYYKHDAGSGGGAGNGYIQPYYAFIRMGCGRMREASSSCLWRRAGNVTLPSSESKVRRRDLSNVINAVRPLVGSAASEWHRASYCMYVCTPRALRRVFGSTRAINNGQALPTYALLH